MALETVVAGIIVWEGRILLGRRSPARAFFPNVWDVFGGHVEAGEQLEQTLARELQEELGIVPLEWRYVEMLSVSSGEPPVDVRCHFYLVTAWQGTPSNLQPEEHIGIGWFSLEDVLRLDLAHPAYPQLFARCLPHTRPRDTAP